MADVGRPTDYSQELADTICERIATGESMRSVSRDDEMPAMATLFRWLREKEEFREQYAIAKDESADAHADDINDIARKTLNGDYEPAAARVALDAFKWTAARLKPKKYGDRLDLNHDGQITVVMDRE